MKCFRVVFLCFSFLLLTTKGAEEEKEEEEYDEENNGQIPHTHSPQKQERSLQMDPENFLMFINMNKPPRPEDVTPVDWIDENMLSYQRAAAYEEMELSRLEYEQLIEKEGRNAIAGIKTPYVYLDQTKDGKYKDPWIWFVHFNDSGFHIDIVCLILIPLFIGKIFSFVLKAIHRRLIVPGYEKRDEPVEFPQVPLVYLQQTALEQETKRDQRNSIHWMARKFIIRANDTFIELSDVILATHTRQVLARNPWQLLHFMVKFEHEIEKQKKRTKNNELLKLQDN